jgi:hypothetical protein
MDSRVYVQLVASILGSLTEDDILTKQVLSALLVLEPAEWLADWDGLEHLAVD